MADLSALKLKKMEQTNWEEYPVGGGTFGKLLPPGEYVGVAPDKFEFEAKDGYLQAKLEIVKIIDVPEGYNDEVRYVYLSTKPRDKGRRKGSCSAGDYLLATGSEDRPGSDPQEWADAIEATAGAQFKFVLGWDCYDSETEKNVARNYDEFPNDPNNPGEKLPYVVVKRGDKEVRLAGRQGIRFYVFGESE